MHRSCLSAPCPTGARQHAKPGNTHGPPPQSSRKTVGRQGFSSLPTLLESCRAHPPGDGDGGWKLVAPTLAHGPRRPGSPRTAITVAAPFPPPGKTAKPGFPLSNTANHQQNPPIPIESQRFAQTPATNESGGISAKTYPQECCRAQLRLDKRTSLYTGVLSRRFWSLVARLAILNWSLVAHTNRKQQIVPNSLSDKTPS